MLLTNRTKLTSLYYIITNSKKIRESNFKQIVQRAYILSLLRLVTIFSLPFILSRLVKSLLRTPVSLIHSAFFET